MENLTLSWQIYLVLLLAVAAGWILGFIRARRRVGRGRYNIDAIFEDYFIGLNYLLNDEPDEAIDTFIKALEVNSETVETHLALGALLRRRGKVDKAIKVHQALLARPGLDASFADSTRLQLALNYIAAGLLDRAERLLRELLAEGSDAQWDALTHLITIYQTEKEWDEAIACATRLLANPAVKKRKTVRGAAAHYCCELAERHIENDERGKAQELIRQARAFDRDGVRAALLSARLEQESGRYQAAVKALQEIHGRAPDFISQILPMLRSCHARLGSESEYEVFLRTALADTDSPDVVVELAQVLERRQGAPQAEAFLQRYLERRNEWRVLLCLLRLQVKTDGADRNVVLLQQILETQLAARPTYRCSHCGYEPHHLNWLCPSCQKWDTIKPINESSS